MPTLGPELFSFGFGSTNKGFQNNIKVNVTNKYKKGTILVKDHTSQSKLHEIHDSPEMGGDDIEDEKVINIENMTLEDYFM